MTDAPFLPFEDRLDREAALSILGAATDGADVAAYNPAGIMQMENGTHLQIDGQFLFLDYSHNYNDTENDMSGNPIVPSIFAIHKKDKWAAYGTFTIIGGGGLVEYENGNIVTETIGKTNSSYSWSTS